MHSWSRCPQVKNTDPKILGEVNYRNFVKSQTGVDSPLLTRDYPLLQRVKELKLLSKTAESGLLSTLEAQGVTLSQVEKALPLAEELGLIDLLLGNGNFLLNGVAPLAVEPAPILLPLLAKAVGVPGSLYKALALGLVGLEGFIIYTNDSIAVDALTAVPLLLAGGVLFTLGNVLDGLKSA
eukprot:scaffold1724_cov246-Pinguiococcus_pyrenoidosus.AAC.7